jgi:hypothetical protein
MNRKLGLGIVALGCVLANSGPVRAEIIGVGLGHVLPMPETLGPYEMTFFPEDPQPDGWVTTVASPLGGALTFSEPLWHVDWNPEPWGGYPPPDSYNADGPFTIQLPPETRAFSLYVGISTGAVQSVTVTADGQTEVTQIIDTWLEPAYFGFYVDDPSETIETLSVPVTFSAAVGAFAVVVPEPSTIWLFAPLLLLVRFKRARTAF